MSNAEVLQLDVWKGDWGLPSVDIECLQVLVRWVDGYRLWHADCSTTAVPLFS